MESDLKHLEFLLKCASSLNLFENNNVTFKVAVNDYRYYKAKFAAKYKQQPKTIEDGLNAQAYWKDVKHPYDGKTKYGFKSKSSDFWLNFPWVTFKNKYINK